MHRMSFRCFFPFACFCGLRPLHLQALQNFGFWLTFDLRIPSLLEKLPRFGGLWLLSLAWGTVHTRLQN